MITGAITATEWTAFGGVLFIIICALVGALYRVHIREMRDIKSFLIAQVEINTKLSTFMENYKEDRDASKADRKAYQESIGVQSGRIDNIFDQIQKFKNDITVKMEEWETVVDKTVEDIKDSKDRYDKAADALGKVKKHYEKEIKGL